jgi:hypothetical protein
MAQMQLVGLSPQRNLADVRSPSAAATNLGLGTGNSPTFTGISGTGSVEVQCNKNVANGYPGLDSSGNWVSSIVLLNGLSSNSTYMAFIPQLGQPAWVSDTKTLVVGDSTTAISSLPPVTFGSFPGYGTPSVAINGSNAGTGATIGTTGTDAGFTVTLTTGSSTPIANQAMLLVTLGETYGFVPVYTMSPANAAANTLTGAKCLFVRQDTAGYNSFSVYSGAVALSASTTYVWNLTLGY